VTVQDHSVGIECIFRASDSKLGAAEPAQVKLPYARVRSEEGIVTGCFGVLLSSLFSLHSFLFAGHKRALGGRPRRAALLN